MGGAVGIATIGFKLGRQSGRWFCAQCDEDICFSCWPNEKPMAAAALDDSTICNFTEPLTPVCLVCKGHSLKQMVIASGILNSCDMCHYVLRGGDDINFGGAQNVNGASAHQNAL